MEDRRSAMLKPKQEGARPLFFVDFMESGRQSQLDQWRPSGLGFRVLLVHPQLKNNKPQTPTLR